MSSDPVTSNTPAAVVDSQAALVNYLWIMAISRARFSYGPRNEAAHNFDIIYGSSQEKFMGSLVAYTRPNSYAEHSVVGVVDIALVPNRQHVVNIAMVLGEFLRKMAVDADMWMRFFGISDSDADAAVD